MHLSDSIVVASTVRGPLFDSWVFGWLAYTIYMKACYYLYIQWVTLVEALLGMDWYATQNRLNTECENSLVDYM